MFEIIPSGVFPVKLFTRTDSPSIKVWGCVSVKTFEVILLTPVADCETWKDLIAMVSFTDPWVSGITIFAEYSWDDPEFEINTFRVSSVFAPTRYPWRTFCGGVEAFVSL